MTTKADARQADSPATATPAATASGKSTFQTAKERLALGQARRKVLKRADHALWKAKDRKEDPLALLKRSTTGRVPELVELKNQRMACSPFGYFRGAVPVMAYDLSLTANTGIRTQLCGDAHVRNLGAFAGPDGRLVFDINDFDETVVGAFEWDVKRMATSLILAGREASVGGGHCREAAMAFVARYRRMMHLFSTMPVIEVVRYQVHRLGEVGPVSEILLAAKRSTPVLNLRALTETNPDNKSGRIFRTNPPVLERVTGEVAEKVVASLVPYEESLLPERRRFLAQYRVIDVAFKVVGTGSVGLRDYCVYMEGNGRKDPLFLQIKEEAHSAYAPYVGRYAMKSYHQGRRVVEGERSMQLQSDPFLGWTKIEGRDYLVRQLNDHKGSLDMTTIKASGLMEYASVCGEMLARGHARGGDCAMLAGYIGMSERFDGAITQFAETYADQTEKDWEELVKSLKKTAPAAASKAAKPPKKKA
jgi:uncharacterized protein (DUF2252 family)